KSSHCLGVSECWDYRIHFAIARHLAQDGAHMVVSGQKQQNVGWAVATLSMVGTMCHLGKAEDQEWLVVTVKGQAVGGEDGDTQIQGSSVVLVSSMVGYVPIPLGACNTSRTALLGLSKSLAMELAPKDIWVNCLVPGIIKTDFVQMGRLREREESLRESNQDGHLKDCAITMSFLCSADASYVTGESILVAGFSQRLCRL
uniref:3-oxoacyl-[acyl-carrier-protein] reductase n=1 Tax=Piliocolobus tephrosceles TaxID=591936 RepID=A0A8C9H4Y3_9PRIM